MKKIKLTLRLDNYRWVSKKVNFSINESEGRSGFSGLEIFFRKAPKMSFDGLAEALTPLGSYKTVTDLIWLLLKIVFVRPPLPCSGKLPVIFSC